MAFTTYCSAKGCGNTQEPYLDTNDNKVYCSNCNSEIPNITQFVKSQMKMNKQFRQKQTKTFSVKCNKCGKEERPKLVKVGAIEDIVCGVCSKSLDSLTPIFKNMLKEKLKTVDKDI